MCGSAGNAHFLLDQVDGLNNICIRINREITDLSVFRCVFFRSLQHFLQSRFGPGKAKIQRIQHLIIAARQRLIGLLQRFKTDTHFIGVVGHVCNSHIGIFSRRRRITIQRAQQRPGKAGDGLHVLVCRHPGGLVRVVGVLHHRVGARFKQRLHAAGQLLEAGIGVQAGLGQNADSGGRCTCPGNGGFAQDGKGRADLLAEPAPAFCKLLTVRRSSLYGLFVFAGIKGDFRKQVKYVHCLSSPPSARRA